MVLETTRDYGKSLGFRQRLTLQLGAQPGQRFGQGYGQPNLEGVGGQSLLNHH